jgi:hypothetical protein
MTSSVPKVMAFPAKMTSQDLEMISFPAKMTSLPVAMEYLGTTNPQSSAEKLKIFGEYCTKYVLCKTRPKIPLTTSGRCSTTLHPPPLHEVIPQTPAVNAEIFY